VKNYTQEQLERLVPGHPVVQERDAQQTIVAGEELTQWNHMVSPVDTFIEDTDTVAADAKFATSDNEETPFANSLVVDDLSPLAMASARDVLKPQLTEVLQCLDLLKFQKSIKKATMVLNKNLAN
jgi:hypothetical protein